MDDHVRRTIERQNAPRQSQQVDRHGQGLLFEPDEFKARPKPKLTKTKDGLIVADDLLFARPVSPHSIAKAYGAKRYCEIVGTAMRGKFPELWWVELFAGPERLFIRDSGRFVDGSPIDALRIRNPFNGYVFADLSLPCVESLRRRVGLQPNVHVLSGNANGAELHDAITAVVPKNALVVLYADPEGLELHWRTLEHFIDRYRHLDILLNLPVNGVIRYLTGGHTERAIPMLNHPAPQLLVEPDGTKGTLLREWMKRNLAAKGFDKIYDHPVPLHGRSNVLYDLMLASRHPLAQKFFEIAIQGWESAVAAAAGA